MNINSETMWTLWIESDLLELGQQLCSKVPALKQPEWFGHLLTLALSDEENVGNIGLLLEVIADQSRWSETREIFHSLREETIVCEKLIPLNNRKLGILYLAENIAKVTFNNSNAEPHRFDSDAGHWIPLCLKFLIDHSNETSINDALLYHLLGGKQK